MNAAVVAAPPSKSLSHRAVIAASLAKGTSALDGVLESEDLTRTIGILRACGADIERLSPGGYRIRGLDGAIRGGTADAPLDCFAGESGTTCRLLTAVLAAGQGCFHIHGSGRMHERPIRELTGALKKLGASVTFTGKNGCPPLLLRAGGLTIPSGGSWLGVSCDDSSQYLSGLLLAAPLAGVASPAGVASSSQEGLRLLLAGERAVSWPYVGLTLQTLSDFGVSFQVQTRDNAGKWQESHWRSLRSAVPGSLRIRVRPGRYRPFSGRVEGDYSGASYLLAAGALGPRPVTVNGLARDSLQGDAAILDILGCMGAKVVRRDGAVTVSPPHGGRLRGLDLDMGDCPDLVPTVAVLAARATGETRIRGAAHLRLKESDRLAAPARELTKTGCTVIVTDDGLRVLPPAGAMPSSLALSCHNDHRMAMSLALLELAGDMRISLDDPACVAKSFPNFWTVWRQIHPQSAAGETP